MEVGIDTQVLQNSAGHASIRLSPRMVTSPSFNSFLTNYIVPYIGT